MFNVTILKMKDIKQYFIGIISTIIIVIVISKSFPQYAKEEKICEGVKGKIEKISGNSILVCLEQTVPTMATINDEYKKIANEDDIKEENILQGILKTQISSIQAIETIEEKSKKEQDENKEQQNEQNIEKAEIGLTTQVITENPISESYNVEYGKVKIKNQTDYELTRRYIKTRYYNRK